MKKNRIKQYLKNKTIQEAIIFLIMATFLLFYSLISHYKAIKMKWQMSPYLFPLLISALMIFLSLNLAIKGIKNLTSGFEIKKLTPILHEKVIFTIIISIAYYFLMIHLHFILSTVLFLNIMFKYFGEKKIWFSVLISLIVAFGIYGVFHVLLKIMLP